MANGTSTSITGGSRPRVRKCGKAGFTGARTFLFGRVADRIIFPSRPGGREAIDLRPDRSFIAKSTLANYRYHRATGFWKLHENDAISFDATAILGRNEFMILSLTGDKLVIKK